MRQAKAPIVRPISRWVEDEIILPTGPFVGERYRHSRHPASALWFNAIGSGKWSRFAATGPTQNGKSLMCYVAPSLYWLFEVGETVIVGLPNMDMANDKWAQDFKPVIESSRYRELLPTKGEGSKGGQVKRAVAFRNGATLRFMSAGGSDKKRAGYTARVVSITETDGMDEAGEASREADKIEQIEGRTRAFGRTGKRVFLECTVSIEKGRIWQEVKQGTDSRIVRPCPHCRAWVTPEREHLVGWNDAQSETEAAEKAYFACPACGDAWTEADRHEAAKRAKLVHRGQEVTPEGEIVGSEPPTQTLGFRWSAIDNPFVTAADLGAEEWKALNANDRENAEKKMRQFVWAVPYEPPDVDLTPLEASEVRTRKGSTSKGVVPSDSLGVVIGVDTGKQRLHWVALSISSCGPWQVIDYGKQKVEADRLGVFHGLLVAFREMRAYFAAHLRPAQVWIDSGYHEHTDAVYALCEESNKGASDIYRPTKGYGEGQARIGRYMSPNSKTRDITYVGKEYYISKVRRNGKLIPGVQLVHVNADQWKSETHQRLMMPTDADGAIVLFDTPQLLDHQEYAAHLTAEKQVEKFVQGRGTVVVWDRIDRNNHFLDATYGATAAGDFLLSAQNASARRIAVIPAHMRRS